MHAITKTGVFLRYHAPLTGTHHLSPCVSNTTLTKKTVRIAFWRVESLFYDICQLGVHVLWFHAILDKICERRGHD